MVIPTAEIVEHWHIVSESMRDTPIWVAIRTEARAAGAGSPAVRGSGGGDPPAAAVVV